MQNNILVILSFAFYACVANTQEGKSQILQRTNVEKTGCYMYFIGTSMPWDITEISTRDTLFVAQSSYKEVTYGAFIIKYNEVSDELKTDDGKKNNMLHLLNLFKDTYNIKRCMGVGLGRTLEAYPAVIGAIDYCEDDTQQRFVIHTWSNGNIIAILYLFALEETEININLQEVYFNGFHFP
jgi:hypothetical protein